MQIRGEQDALLDKLKKGLKEVESRPFVSYLSIRSSHPVLLPIVGEAVDANSDGAEYLNLLAHRFQPAYGGRMLTGAILGDIIENYGETYNLRKKSLKEVVNNIFEGDEVKLRTESGRSSGTTIVYRDEEILKKSIRKHITSSTSKTVVEIKLDL